LNSCETDINVYPSGDYLIWKKCEYRIYKNLEGKGEEFV
jgi:hypothetical protein